MRKILFVLVLILPSYAMAQDRNQLRLENAPHNTTAPKVEEKAKPVILKKDGELRELRLVTLELENLQLRYKELQSALEKMQAEVKKADDSVTDFWAKLGVNRTELSTKWKVSNGQNGDIILTREAEKPTEKADKP